MRPYISLECEPCGGLVRVPVRVDWGSVPRSDAVPPFRPGHHIGFSVTGGGRCAECGRFVRWDDTEAQAAALSDAAYDDACDELAHQQEAAGYGHCNLDWTVFQ